MDPNRPGTSALGARAMSGTKRPAPPAGAPGGGAPKRPYVGEDDEPPEWDEDLEDADGAMQEMIPDDIELVAATDTAVQEKWLRPALPAGGVNPGARSLLFQQVDIDYVIDKVDTRFSSQVGKAAQLRMFGVTPEGNSVCCFVHGFEPYFYAPAPPGFGPDDLPGFKSVLNRGTAENAGAKARDVQGPLVTRVELVQKQTVWNYQSEKSRTFIKITMALPTLVTAARSALEKGMPTPTGGSISFPTFESNVLFVLRYMIDTDIVGGNWVEAKQGKYKLRTDGGHRKPASSCQIEFDVHYKDIISHPAEGPHSVIAPLRIVSVDIECMGRKGHFPDAKLDPVIQIASVLTVQGESSPAVKNVMTLGTCSAIVGAEVMPFADERQLLRAWRDFIIATDPDMIIGYNIVDFDLPYLLDRAETLRLTDFPVFGRIRGSMIKMRNTTFSSKAYGTRETKEITLEGRVQFDLLQAVRRDYKLSSYSLNNVSAHFLGEQKEDVHHSIISDLQQGNAETRRRLAVYCLKDALLPQRLLDSLMYMYNYTEMARVTGVPISFLLSKGQSIKVLSQILRKCRQQDLVVPVVQRTQNDATYEGATVLEAKAGYYEKPIATLDFASLYPSIMMAHNLCYTTLVPPQMASSFAPEQIEKTPNGDYFVKESVRKGLLPEILQELLGARKRAKADMKKATDPLAKAVLNGRQLALKVSANSVYGFTGATVGKLPCLAISSSTTAYGRQMIEQTMAEVKKRYTVANGYAADADVVYGDTDSVFVNFNLTQDPDDKDGTGMVKEAMRLGEEAAALVTETFPKPIKLEFEKVYFPFLLLSKKRYAGMYWTNPVKWDKMDTTGIETQRRDNCALVRDVLTHALNKILMDRDVNGAAEYVKERIRDLLQNRLDMSMLVISKALSQDVEAYDAKAPHVELAKRMRKRDPATAPATGDRVAYVIVKGAKGAKAYEKAEDPIYALEHNLPLDTRHYLEMLKAPLLRIFDPCLKNAQSLLTGDHTRAITISTPSMSGGGIMRFAKVQAKCLGCKAPLSGAAAKGALCPNCSPRAGEIYYKSLSAANDLEEQFSRLWTQCQSCSGTLHQDVLCSNRDCAIFYRRKKVQKELDEKHAELARW